MVGKKGEVVVELAGDLVVLLKPPVLAVGWILLSPQMLKFLLRFLPRGLQDVGQRDRSEHCSGK
eukprot:COSAG02_NODE_36878_length_449_cov_0.971429_1_plen_63_part_10